MQHTFSYQRQEILQEPMITEVRNRWPALFEIGEVNLEFMRITTVPLISKFIGQLDKYTDGLMKVFRHKGGCAGQKIHTIMALTAKNEDKNTRRDCILRCLSVYLNEDIKTLVKEYVDSESVEAESLIAQTTMDIYVIRAEGAGPEEEPSDVVVLEGVEVLQNLPSVTLGCVMLFGLIYAKDLKCTFEAFQKILMELDSTKLSPKVQGLKIKMLQ
ncbi:uncharacterized protein LOC127966582 [Carassius gibelio]|uniref:uncharacterized protein LOC127966582 n=1 Tax=Carassius gibelio TaxID=101364 RepID=UPI002279828E|nr:uncharacterized protein LOC127966582 [Carassius gibelio]